MKIVMTDLATDKLKAEENLQNIINTKDDATLRVTRIKLELERIVLIDNMINKWLEYMTADESDNNNNNNKEK